MKKTILMIFIVALSSACIKQEQEQNSESQIVDMLNQNQTTNALAKINEELKTNPSDEVYYLKASALSIKAGVDIYALFPLLKVKIFDVAISQWSQNREFQKKADAVKIDIGLKSEDADTTSSENNKKKYIPLDLAKSRYTIINQEMLNRESTDKGLCEIAFIINIKSKDHNEDVWKNYYSPSEEMCDDVAQAREVKITPELDEVIKEELLSNDKRNWTERNKKIGEKENYVKILGTFWTMIDMIPMISKIPKISTEGFADLQEAQEILEKIRLKHRDANDEIGAKARKQLMMLSALKIVGHIQNSFDLKMIKTPVDFICSSNQNAAEELVASEKDALYLINAIEDPEIIKKNKLLIEGIKKRFGTLIQEQDENPEVRNQTIRKVTDELEAYRRNNCQ